MTTGLLTVVLLVAVVDGWMETGWQTKGEDDMTDRC